MTHRDSIKSGPCAARRSVLKKGLMLAAAAGTALAETAWAAPVDPVPSRTLVAFFSRSGNTRLVAQKIRTALGAAMFEIEPLSSYPEDYETTVRLAEEETRRGALPPIKTTVSNLGAFDTVFLGFPIWGTTAPPVIRSFLSAHDFGGKTIVPFITHGGYGRGSALSVLADHAPGARIADGFLMEGEQERRVVAQVADWLGKPGPIRKS